LKTPKPDEATVLAEQFRRLIDTDQVVELRALNVKNGSYRPYTVGGFFDGQHLLEMAQAALSVSPNATGTYFTLNPIDPALLARRSNRIERAEEGQGAKDKDTVSRRWLLIDADPVRPAGISATDDEKGKAHQVALNTRDYLRGRDWPDPMLNDSGNGFHLLYKVDLPADDDGLVKDILWILGHRLDTREVKIDQAVFNPARICKLPGTWSRKGDNTPDRPHRKSSILECPDPVQEVPRELLESLAEESRDIQRRLKDKEEAERKKTQPSNSAAKTGGYPLLLVENWLRDRGVDFRVKSGRDDQGRMIYVLKECPFDSSHGKDSCVMQATNGQLSTKCFHDGCAGNHWAQFRDKIGKPERKHYDPATLSSEKSGTTSKESRSTNAADGKPDPIRTPKELVFNTISNLRGKPVRYLVPGRLAAGKMTIIAGRGGSGKSTLTRSLAASLSSGRPAFGMKYEAVTGDVLLVVAEDDPSDTILPHLLSEGANLRRIHVLECVKRGDQKAAFTLRPEDIELLRERLERTPEIKLVVIDPITTFVGRAKVDDHKATELRAILDPLNELAAKTGVAILLVAHLNKGNADAVDRIAGSAAYRDAVRAAYFCGADPEDDARRVLIPIKHNLIGFEQTAISFSDEPLCDLDADTVMMAPQFGDLLDWERKLQREQLRRVAFGTSRAVDANEISKGKNGDAKPKVKACAEWLKEFLKEHAYPAQEIETHAAKQGFTRDNVFKAKAILKQEDLRNSNQGGFSGVWWSGFGHRDTWTLRPESSSSSIVMTPMTTHAPKTGHESPKSHDNGKTGHESPKSHETPNNEKPSVFLGMTMDDTSSSGTDQAGPETDPRSHCHESHESRESHDTQEPDGDLGLFPNPRKGMLPD
jgi:hypothetical protein